MFEKCAAITILQLNIQETKTKVIKIQDETSASKTNQLATVFDLQT